MNRGSICRPKHFAGRLRAGKVILFTLMFLSALVTGWPAHATESGGGAYHNGAEDFMAGAVPPPGTYAINYFNYFAASKFAGSDGKSAVPDFKLRVAADVVRVIHITDKKILGGFWGMHVFIPVVYMDVRVPGASDRRGSLGDIIVDPFILSWHGKNWHAATGIDIYTPTGTFNRDHLANPGRDYWTFEPIIAGTYLTDSGFEVSAKLMYDINTKNNDTGYLSGQEFHMDYLVGQHLGDFSLGMGGYYYQQVSDDKLNGITLPDHKGRVLAFGPAVKYQYKNMSASLKYDFETATLNRPEGESLWFKFVYAF